MYAPTDSAELFGSFVDHAQGLAAHSDGDVVLHALCELQWQLGRRPESFETAREAMPLCLERGAVKLADADRPASPNVRM